MKLLATDQKVIIQWFAVMHDGSKIRNNKGFIHNAWEAKCSCGWESKTGGAIKSAVVVDVDAHKYAEHKETIKPPNLLIFHDYYIFVHLIHSLQS